VYDIVVDVRSFIIGEPGMIINLSVDLYGFNNRQETYTIEMTDELGWTDFAPMDVTLAPMDNTTLIANVEIPEDIQMQSINTVTITATSKSNSSYWDSDSTNILIEINDTLPPSIELIHPKEGYLYILDHEIIPLKRTLVIGPITVKADVEDKETGVNSVEFYIDNELRHTDDATPYEWLWDETIFLEHTLKVVAYDNQNNSAVDERTLWIFNL
jgi:hypothetical protein